MAILNGLYIHVVDEQIASDVTTTSHPVENGIPLTDTVKANAVFISLSGKIVDYGDKTATQVIAKLDELKNKGSLIEYRGRNVVSSMQIQSFDRKHPNTNNGGADFSMELKQVRIAKSAYTPKAKKPKPEPEQLKKTIEEGDTVVFKGGAVYVSSDAQNRAATRNRSTCKVLYINNASWAKHPYCLQSTDGELVCGWVDAANVEGVEPASTNAKTNAGTKQVTSSNSKTEVYHKVKSGDTVWALVNNTYKSLNTTCDWVISNNPDAFSKKGDATTLQVGKKLLMGYKS